MSNADRCMRCGSERRSHDTYPNDPHAFVEPGPQADSAATIAHAFEPPPRGTYACGLCGRSELHSDHPAQPNPAPSGDEAKVREIAHAEAESIATRWVPAHMTARQGMVDDITASLVRHRALGADAGKADCARRIERLRKKLDKAERQRDEARADLRIARRGSEGK